MKRSRWSYLLVASGAVLLTGLVLWIGHRPVTPESSPDVFNLRAIQEAHPGFASAFTDAAGLKRHPGGLYIVINTHSGELLLRNQDRVFMRTPCSTGSGYTLVDSSGSRSWSFDTPTGVRQVHGKLVRPVWMRPDWSYVEEGKPLPRNASDRAEAGVLGAYALDLGNGYFIHGTLYTTLLGMNVTHGCIRVGDDELELLNRHVHTGTPVILF